MDWKKYRDKISQLSQSTIRKISRSVTSDARTPIIYDIVVNSKTEIEILEKLSQLK